jgi:hypothetical protein
MKQVTQRAFIGCAMVILALALGADPASAARTQSTASPESPGIGVLVDGQRVINGDGDTAGKCLDNAGVGTELSLQMWQCNDGRQQDWNYVDRGGGLWQIYSRLNNNCVSAEGHGAQAAVVNCSFIVGPPERSSFFWYVRNYPGGWHRWESARYRGQCLDVRGSGTSNVVQLWDCLDQGNQKWHVY